MHTTSRSAASALIEKISSRRAHPDVIGLGYVGLPLAVEPASAGIAERSPLVVDTRNALKGRTGAHIFRL